MSARFPVSKYTASLSLKWKRLLCYCKVNCNRQRIRKSKIKAARKFEELI